MASDLSAYKVSSGEVASSSKFDNMVQAVQDALNAIGDTSKMAFSAGLIFDPAQIKQAGATSGQALVWNGSAWAPATVGGGGGGGDSLWTHDTFTSDVTFTATSEGTATTVKTTTSKTYDGNPVLVEFFSPRIESNASTLQSIFIVLLRDSTVIAGKWCSLSTDNVLPSIPVLLGIRDTPSAGAHTYTAKVYSTSANGGTVKASTGGSGNVAPGYLRVFKDS